MRSYRKGKKKISSPSQYINPAELGRYGFFECQLRMQVFDYKQDLGNYWISAQASALLNSIKLSSSQVYGNSNLVFSLIKLSCVYYSKYAVNYNYRIATEVQL